MKRIVSLLLSILILMSLCTCALAAEFWDLSPEHWAYNNIKVLVDEGTINGYEDGTFQPNKSVTRAEFVKMLGKWNQQYQGVYKDLPKNHWGYEYIMWSGLDGLGDNILPDTPIKREDVINLIWKRNGSPKHGLAPNAIKNQGSNPDATSWAYTIGLMKGDDGLTLRLDSSLTRAEAATLIVRSRELVAKNEKHNFIDTVNGEILKGVYESLDLLGDEYSPDKKLTYGELARMAVVFGADGANIHFINEDLYNDKGEVYKTINHEYDHEMFILASRVWGDKYYSSSMIDKPATKQDALSAIIHGFVRRNTLPPSFGYTDILYPDCKDIKSTVWEEIYLGCAAKNGIRLKASENIGADETITVKEYSAMMLLLNETCGLGVKYVGGVRKSEKINILGNDMPANYKDYKYTLKGIPSYIYSAKNAGVKPKNDYKLASALSSTYYGCLSEFVALAKKDHDISLEATYYPSLTYNENGRTVFAAKFKIKDISKDAYTINIDDVFSRVTRPETGLEASVNNDIYVIFETYETLMDIYLPYSAVYVKAIYVR